MNLKPKTDSITVQNEILKTTQGLIFKVGGITLDAALFSAGVVKAGTPVSIKTAPVDGKSKPWADTDTGIPYVTTHDVKIETGADAIVGAFEEAYFNKTKVTFTAAFLTASANRYKTR